MEPITKGWNALRKEGFVRLVFYRGFLQAGFLAAALFILLSAVRGDSHFSDHALRALVAFPLGGLVFGGILWMLGKLFGRDGPEQTTNKT